MDVVFLCAPGVGKGTQAPRLAAHLGVPAVATGDVLRAAVRQGTPRGLEAKRYMDRGDLVPDSVILAIMKERLAEDGARAGSVLDGVVRTIPQAEGLDRMLADLGRRVDYVLTFDLPESDIVRRLSGRTTCDVCQTPFTGREPGTACPKGDGGTLARRADDEPAAVRKRLAVYQQQTAPVLGWYERHGGRVKHIDASASPDAVFARIKAALADVL
ncbi:MAG: adenylate kinase [Gemmatimonadaceae bacterium]